jgi:hypothetical protein
MKSRIFSLVLAVPQTITMFFGDEGRNEFSNFICEAELLQWERYRKVKMEENKE